MEKINKILTNILIGSTLLIAGCSSDVATSPVVTESNKEILINNPELEIKKVEERDSLLTKDNKDISIEEIDTSFGDGIFTETFEYSAPPGSEVVDFEIEFDGDIIVSLSFISQDSHPTSEKYIERSEQGLQDLLIGKNINNVEIPDKISGSSLTTKAFKNKINSLL